MAENGGKIGDRKRGMHVAQTVPVGKGLRVSSLHQWKVRLAGTHSAIHDVRECRTTSVFLGLAKISGTGRYPSVRTRLSDISTRAFAFSAGLCGEDQRLVRLAFQPNAPTHYDHGNCLAFIHPRRRAPLGID